MNRPLFSLLLILISTPITANEIKAGSYKIETRMLLPHLEEMRRTVTTEIICLEEDDVSALFPILKQPGMAGCLFVKKQSSHHESTYLLQCPGKNAATGTAQLKKNERGVSADLYAKMGGKNMTFSQFSKAEWLGGCAQ